MRIKDSMFNLFGRSRSDTHIEDDVYCDNTTVNPFTQIDLSRSIKENKEEHMSEQLKQENGTKYDADKPRMDLLPTKAIKEIVKVLEFGATKYGDWNWFKGIFYSRMYAAMQRHLTSWYEGEDTDPETDISHLAHAGCNLLFLLTYEILGFVKLDDRPDYTVTKKDE